MVFWLIHTFISIIPEDKIYQPEEKYHITRGKNAVHEAEDKDEDSRWQVKAVLEQRRLDQLCIVSWRFGTHQSDGIEGDATKFQEPKW
jgi:hypothetical protein